MASVIALIIACLIPLLYLYLIRRADFYKTGNFRYVLLSVAWGLVAYELAVLVNTTLVDEGIVSRDQLIRFAAPAIEEILKGIIIFYLVSRADFRYFVDGAIYGFGAGIGFAIVENFEYVLGHPEAALMVAISRVSSTNLIHATGSAILGVALGHSRFDHSGSLRRWGALAVGLLLSIGLHTGFNNMASNGMLLAYAIASGLGAAAFIWYVIKQGLAEEKRWIEEKLPEFGRITHGEAAIVNQFEQVKKLLAPVAQHFGYQTADLCEEFLRKQAHLGILRKSAEKFKDNEPMRQAN
jgi:RsiW-degrading membrane proteinase PrsW (M82 family)